MSRFEDTWAIVDGVPMYGRVSTGRVPSGRWPIVLVHGMVVSGRYMLPLAEQLAPYYRVCVPDLPGFGRSLDHGPVLGVTELADALARWMTAIGMDRAVILGHSVGCQVATAFAVRHPDRLERVILVSPTLEPAARNIAVLVARWLRDTVREPLALKPILVRDFLAAGPRRALCMTRYMLQDRIEQRLGRITVPALVVHGARSAIASRSWAERVARLLPRGELAVVPGASHAVNYAAPVALAGLVRAFVGEAGPEDPPSCRNDAGR